MSNKVTMAQAVQNILMRLSIVEKNVTCLNLEVKDLKEKNEHLRNQVECGQVFELDLGGLRWR